MKTRDPQKTKARKIVSERLRLFVAMLMRQFTTSASELWSRAERKATSAENDKSAAR